MAFCKYCGKELDAHATFCSECGKKNSAQEVEDNIINSSLMSENNNAFTLTANENRNYSINIADGIFTITGDYWYLRDKNFYSNHQKTDKVYIKDYIGCGYITKRSYRKCIEFVGWAVLFTIIKNIIDFIGKFAETPKPLAVIYYIVILICALNLLRYFFDKKKVIDISFMGKRFAVPQKSLTDYELHNLKRLLEANGVNE